MSQHVKSINCVCYSALILLILLGLTTSGIRAEEPSGHGIPYQTVADYIHDIIEADRTLYTTHVVNRMQETGTAIASESWEDRNALPLPAQMLLLSGERVKNRGGGLNYRLASLWPTYKKTGRPMILKEKAYKRCRRIPMNPSQAFSLKEGRASMWPSMQTSLFRNLAKIVTTDISVASSAAEN